MKLLTKELKKQFPKLGETDGMDKSKIQVIAKFFTPWTNWTWYATEGQFDFLVLVCYYNKDGELIREQGSNMTDDEKEALCGLWESIPKRPLPFSCEENDLRNFMNDKRQSSKTSQSDKEEKRKLQELPQKPEKRSQWKIYQIIDFTFFGYVEGHESERDLHFSTTLLGYFSLSELESIQGLAGLRIERDLHFSATLEEVIEGKRR